MLTERLELTNALWTEVLASGGNLVASDASGDLLLHVGPSAPTSDNDAHSVKAASLNEGFSFNNVPTADKLFLKSVGASASVVVTR